MSDCSYVECLLYILKIEIGKLSLLETERWRLSGVSGFVLRRLVGFCASGLNETPGSLFIFIICAILTSESRVQLNFLFFSITLCI